MHWNCGHIRRWFTLNIFPNPNTREFTISGDNDISFDIVNELGQFVKHLELNAKNERKALINGLADGVYFLRAKNGLIFEKYKIDVIR